MNEDEFIVEAERLIDEAEHFGILAPRQHRPPFHLYLPGDSVNEVPELLKKGYLPPIIAKDAQDQTTTSQIVSKIRSINVNQFPRGDLSEKFSPWRFAMASALARETAMGETAYKKFAPWEHQYYSVLAKANLGDQVSGQDGGFLAPVDWSQRFFDLLYPRSIFGSPTAPKLPVTRYRAATRIVHFPKLTGKVSVTYVPENAALTPSSPTFAQSTAQMKKQSVLVYLSNELIADSNPSAQELISDHIAREMAIDFDTQVLLGNGQSGAPTGLVNATNVGSGTMGGASLAYTDITNAIYQVEVLNNSTNVPAGQAECTGIVGHPVLKKQIANFKDASGRPLWQFGLGDVRLPGNTSALADWLGVPNFVVSTIMPGTEGSQYVIAGDWQYLMLVERDDIEIMSSTVAGTAFASDQTAIRVLRRYDPIVIHPEAFFVLKNVAS